MLPPGKLPHDRSPLFGRADERAAIAGLLGRDDVGLLTLTGIGGTGKTRLALAVAADMAAAFPEGIGLVELAPVRDPEHVAAAFVRALELREQPGQPLVETLAAAIGAKTILLVVDNCEHVLDAMPLIGQLLERCPGLKVLATSRAPLGLYGERELPVAPLPVLDLSRLGDRPLAGLLSLVERSPAVALFLARAQAVNPGLALTADNAPAVVVLCRALDGLPLALELAAGRTRLLSPAAMCERLDRRLALLTGGSRHRPARQQTMRDSLAWSYELLTGDEQALLRRLGVFVGGFTVAAAEAVGGAAIEPPPTAGPGEAEPAGAVPGAGAARDLSSVLDALVARSLVRSLGPVVGDARFGLLELLREYALEALASASEEAAARRAHAGAMAALAEQAVKGLQTPALDDWLKILDAEQGNLRAALSWCLGVGAEPNTALRIAGNLRIYWDLRGQLREGRSWLYQALAVPGPADEPRRMALNAAGLLAWRHGDLPAAQAHFEAALAMARTFGDRPAEGVLIGNLGLLSNQAGDYLRARELFEASLAIAREGGSLNHVAVVVNNIGCTYLALGDSAAARPYFEEAVALNRQGGDQQLLMDAIENVAIIDGDLGDLVGATAGLEAVLAVRRARNDRTGTATTLGRLALLAEVEGRIGTAARLVRESLALHREVADARGLVDGVAQVATLLGWPLLRAIHPCPPRRYSTAAPPLDDLRLAARLSAASMQRRQADALAFTVPELAAHEANVAALKATLGRREFARSWAGGEALGLEGAVLEALDLAAALAERPDVAEAAALAAGVRFAAGVRSAAGVEPDPPPILPIDDGGLTARELEVAGLVAAGLTYAEMASRLSLSVKSIEKHMGNILAKLDARNRREVALWARARGMGG